MLQYAVSCHCLSLLLSYLGSRQLRLASFWQASFWKVSGDARGGATVNMVATLNQEWTLENASRHSELLKQRGQHRLHLPLVLSLPFLLYGLIRSSLSSIYCVCISALYTVSASFLPVSFPSWSCCFLRVAPSVSSLFSSRHFHEQTLRDLDQHLSAADDDVIGQVLPHWPRLFNRLATVRS